MSIFNFTNYRDYLRAYIKSRPKAGYGELSRIATHLKMNTTLLSQIFSGLRTFSTDHACELAEYLGLTDIETEYLYLMIEHSKAGTGKNKSYLKNRMALLKDESLNLSKRILREKDLTENEKAIFYSTWVYSALHLFCGTRENGVTLDEICDKIQCTRQKASEYMLFLINSGLCKEENERFSIRTLSTFIDNESPHLLKHHNNWRIKAIQKSDNISKKELMFTAQVSISEKDFDIIREQIIKGIEDILKTVKESGTENLAFLNIDWLKL